MSFRLTCVIVSPPIYVILRNPSLGEVESVNTAQRFQRLRSGEPKIVCDGDWPQQEKRTYTFEGLTADEISDLIDFLVATAGYTISIEDHNGDSIVGIVTNTEAIVTSVRDDCSYNIPLEVLLT